jgi:hypothetical protein
MQPSKYSKKDFKSKLLKKSKTTSEVLDKLVVLSYEVLGGLSDPGQRGCVHSVVKEIKFVLSLIYLVYLLFVPFK